ncbi:MAG: DoxX family protein [Chitinophagaceae bacterium]|nr:DoxX family protein [Chitinophagaceae bacterium]
MRNRLLSSTGVWSDGIVLIRIFSGIIIFNFGLQLFSVDAMNGYVGWLGDLGFPAPKQMATIGKVIELVGGAFLIIGLLTRITTVFLIVTMSVITFFMGKWDLLSSDSSWLLLLLFLCVLFTGPGRWSLDYFLFKKKGNALNSVDQEV